MRDPRSDVVKRAVALLSPDAGRIRFAEAVERAALVVLERRKPGRPLQTNLEFYTALLLEALGVPRSAFTGVFAVGRVLGWIAHAQEQAAHGRIIRPQSRYVGPVPGLRSAPAGPYFGGMSETTSKPVIPAAPAEPASPVPPEGAGKRPKEIGGPSGPEPTRYGDWERNGRCSDF